MWLSLPLFSFLGLLAAAVVRNASLLLFLRHTFQVAIPSRPFH